MPRPDAGAGTLPTSAQGRASTVRRQRPIGALTLGRAVLIVTEEGRGSGQIRTWRRSSISLCAPSKTAPECEYRPRPQSRRRLRQQPACGTVNRHPIWMELCCFFARLPSPPSGKSCELVIVVPRPSRAGKDHRFLIVLIASASCTPDHGQRQAAQQSALKVSQGRDFRQA